jgi:tetratricopeptide (TPR) repeat protein
MYRAVLELEPNYVRAYLGMSRAMLELGRMTEAISAAERASEFQQSSAVHNAVLANTWALAGDVVRARKLIAELERAARERYVAPYLFMRAWSGLDVNRSIEYLARAVEERDPRLVHINVSPVYDRLRDDPRFPVLVDKMGLLQRESTAA